MCMQIWGRASSPSLSSMISRPGVEPKQYRSEVLYSIVYDIDEDDEVLKEFINEYNAYTWGDMMRSDRVMDTVLLQLPDVERSVIEASISTEIASDPEFLTAYFTTGDAALSDRIAAAYNCAMTAFGQTMQGRGLTAIEVWKTVSAQAVLPEKCGGARSGARTACWNPGCGSLVCSGRFRFAQLRRGKTLRNSGSGLPNSKAR